MHRFLESVGRWCARRHWLVIGAWVVILVGLVLARGAWGGCRGSSAPSFCCRSCS
jgi:RND superfamily putative drug exporter